MINDGLAAVCRQHPSRFRFVAVLPTTNRCEMVKSWIALSASAPPASASRPISATFSCRRPEVRHFWQEMSRRKLMVLVHPTCPCDAPQNDPGTFLSVGYPNETAMAATKLALAGSARRMPRCENRLVAFGRRFADDLGSHRPRLSAFFELPASAQLLFAPLLLRHGVYPWCRRCTARARPGASNTLVFGTDVPHVPNTEKETIAALNNTGWSTSELDDIFGATAQRLMA